MDTNQFFREPKTAVPRAFQVKPREKFGLDLLAIGASLDYRLLGRTYWAGRTGIVFKSALRRWLAWLAQAVPIDPLRERPPAWPSAEPS
jgi:hypothetical protein